MNEALDDSASEPETKCDVPSVLPLLRAHAEMLHDAMQPEQRDQLKMIPEERLGAETHFTLGMFVRNRWLYAEDSSLMAALDTDDTYSDTDEVGALIIHLLWRQLHGNALTDEAIEQLLREHITFFQ